MWISILTFYLRYFILSSYSTILLLVLLRQIKAQILVFEFVLYVFNYFFQYTCQTNGYCLSEIGIHDVVAHVDTISSKCIVVVSTVQMNFLLCWFYDITPFYPYVMQYCTGSDILRSLVRRCPRIDDMVRYLYVLVFWIATNYLRH